MMMPKDWPIALCMAARLAGTYQRAYRYSDYVRFYPSMALYNEALAQWSETVIGEQVMFGNPESYTRLSDAEAARLWATRPQ